MDHEIPDDDTVCKKLVGLGSTATMHDLLGVLTETHDRRDSQRAIRRCIDRGRIIIGRNFILTVGERVLEDA